MLFRIADTTLKLYENIAGAKLRIALRHGKELTAQGIHLLLGIVHLLDAHAAALEAVFPFLGLRELFEQLRFAQLYNLGRRQFIFLH